MQIAVERGNGDEMSKKRRERCKKRNQGSMKSRKRNKRSRRERT